MSYRRWATASTLVPLAFALLALAGWITGRLRLASLRPEFIPMAPSTAVALLLAGAALMTLASGQRPAAGYAVRAAACLLATLAFIETVALSAGVTMRWEEAIVGHPGTFGAVPLARMSPVTATTLALVGLALACLTSARSARRDLGGMLGALALLVGSGVVLGYAYGAPLLYGGRVIPVALTTGLALMGTGVALVALAGPGRLPLRPFSRAALRAELAEAGRKQAEAARRQGEILARSLVEHLPQRIFIKDLNSRYVFCNANYARDLKIEPRQIVGRDDFAFFPPELAEQYRADDRKVIAGARPEEGEEGYRIAGEERWIHTFKVPYHDEQGEIIGVLGIFEDITERKRAEAELSHERDWAQRYLDTAEVILLKLDLEGRITLVNRYACAVLGWTPGELLGRDWIETCLPARIRDAGRKRFHDLAGGDLPIDESLILTASGEERLIEWRNSLVRHDAGHVIGTFSSGTDITERHRAIEALRTSEERTRFALEAAGVGIWDMDYTTGGLRWSETMEAHYGLQPGTFGGTFEAFIERVHPDDRESARAVVGKAMTSDSEFTLENRTIWPDGSVHWLAGAGRIRLNARGEPVRGVGISMDVTERRTLEKQYQQAQKMDAIGRLAGGVAHDFNNLLTVILGYSELLLDNLDPGGPRQAEAAEVHKAGMRAAGLTRQLLAFSRKQIIEPTRLDLNALVADMRAMLGRLIGEDVTIALDLSPDLSAVMADRGQLEQIVMNLAVNARDAMPRGGTLTIETANVEVDEHDAKTHLDVKPGPYVALTVTDTGTGMTPEVQARLFEPFFTTKEPGKGTGLGLATVHGIVMRSGGSVSVHSEIGRGTSIQVYFPPTDAVEMVVDAPPPVAGPRSGTETVLVVEDQPGLRELARKLLQRQGYTVLVAANADEAVRVFEQHAAIDLLLTDVVMPGASGPELTEDLLARRPELKVLYMSGYTEETIVHHGVLDPGIAFVHKPFTAAALGRKVREVLDR